VSGSRQVGEVAVAGIIGAIVGAAWAIHGLTGVLWAMGGLALTSFAAWLLVELFVPAWVWRRGSRALREHRSEGADSRRRLSAG
jgi:hypothetical protein